MEIGGIRKRRKSKEGEEVVRCVGEGREGVIKVESEGRMMKRKKKEKRKFVEESDGSPAVEEAQTGRDSGHDLQGMNGKSRKAAKNKRQVRTLSSGEDKQNNGGFNQGGNHHDSPGKDSFGAKSEKAKRKKRKGSKLSGETDLLKEKTIDSDEAEVRHVSSGDEDCSKGMKKWVSEYYQRRPGLKELQHRIDEFIVAHEAKLEQERKEREARAAEGGWTVVTHHKGRKKTTDSESGVVVGSVSQAAMEEKIAKKKRKEVGLDFYRFQRKEAQRNEIMMLQSKFNQDKKRIQELRAARKFRPF